MRVVGYVYNGAVHCPDCTRKEWHQGFLVEKSHTVSAMLSSTDTPKGEDENGFPYDLIDTHGNFISALFDDAESDSLVVCDSCDELIDTKVICYCDTDFTDCAAEDHYNKKVGA